MLPTLPLAQRGTRLIAGHTGGGEAGSVPNQGREVVGWSWDHQRTALFLSGALWLRGSTEQPCHVLKGHPGWPFSGHSCLICGGVPAAVD